MILIQIQNYSILTLKIGQWIIARKNMDFLFCFVPEKFMVIKKNNLNNESFHMILNTNHCELLLNNWT